MNTDELDARIDRLSIQKQLEVLRKNLSAARQRIEIANLLWERVMAAEGLLNSKESRLFDDAADTLIELRTLIGCSTE
jgi:hypothetical protein